MRKINSALAIIIGITLLFSCNNAQSPRGNEQHSINKVMQQSDGSIALHVDKAESYRDKKNPSTNTAEWNVVMPKSGRFDVWLSSATIDTTNLGYENKVLLNIHNNVLETLPVINKVVKNTNEVEAPYFRVDSFMGTLYIQDTGQYLVQIISDKILPEDVHDAGDKITEKTKLLSVTLTPAIK